MPQKRFFLLKKWRGSMKMIAILAILYLIFLAISSLFANPSAETYIEVFVGDWLKYGNDSRLQPVFDVLQSTEAEQYIPRESVISVGQGIQVDRYVPNCGMQYSCQKGEFAVHIYTGKDHNDQPMLCVDGKYIIGRNVNSGGRGINVAVIDTLTNKIEQVKNFDTYEHESTQLETLLLTLRAGDILLMLTFDEPTKMLSRVAKLLFHDLGSAMAQNLQYRASWYLVTQKGLNGFAPFEGLNLIESDGWPVPHDRRFCVSLKLEGQAIHPDPLPRSNPSRRDFCNRHQEFPYFCDGDAVNDPLLASAAHRSGLAGNDIFLIPIIVMSGTNITYLATTLETVVRQPGINPKNVVVYYLPQNPQVAELSDLFGFMSEEISSTDACAQVLDAFETTSLLFPDAKAIVFLESDVILSPDFLSYMGQALPVMAMDSSVNFISAFNDNGFEGVSGIPDLLHRVTGASSLAVMIRKNAFSKDMCDKRNRDMWLSDSSEQVIVPDLSRVLSIRPPEGTEARRARNTSMFSEIQMQSVQQMVRDEYDKHLEFDLHSAVAISVDYSTLEQCLVADDGHGIVFLLSDMPSNYSGLPLAVYYKQIKLTDYGMVTKLCRCLGLYVHPDGAPVGSYQGLIRFTWNGRLVYLVSSLSSYYVHKPSHIVPLFVDTVRDDLSENWERQKFTTKRNFSATI